MFHPLLLTVLAAIGGGPSHAELHPSQADLYVELADCSVLLTELEKAPMVRFLRDERVAGILAALGMRTGRPLKEQAGEALTSMLPGIRTGAWLEGLGTSSISLVAVGPDAALPAFLAILDFKTPEYATALQGALLESATSHEPRSSAVPGVVALHMPAAPLEDCWCVVIGSRLVLGSKPLAPEDHAARAGGTLPGLATSSGFRERLAALGPCSGTPILWFALARPIQEIVNQRGAEDVGFRFLEHLPSDLNPLGSPRVARMQFTGERFVTEMVSSAAAGAAASKSVDPAWLEPAPAGSMFVYAGAFDGAAVGKRLRAVLAQDEGGAAALAALEEGLGFGPERLLARLGPGLTVYSAPLAGPGLPEVRAWVDCDDPAAFTSEFETLFNALAAELPGLEAKTRPYKVKQSGSDQKLEVPYTTLTLPQSWQQVPMLNPAPSFARVAEKKLVFALSSMEVKSELKRVHAGEGAPIVAGADPLGTFGFGLVPESRMVLVMDWGRLFASVVTMVKAFAPMLGAEALPFDLAKLPPAEMFTQYFKPTFYYSKGMAGGLYRRNEASFGPETWLPIVQGAVTAFTSLGPAREAARRADDAAAAGDEPPAREPPGGGH
jgi:hypothetical protein